MPPAWKGVPNVLTRSPRSAEASTISGRPIPERGHCLTSKTNVKDFYVKAVIGKNDLPEVGQTLPCFRIKLGFPQGVSMRRAARLFAIATCCAAITGISLSQPAFSQPAQGNKRLITEK